VENYLVTWKLVQDRYENKWLIAVTHVREMLEMKTEHRKSTSELREFINIATSNLNA
jgi:hypothetical protein